MPASLRLAFRGRWAVATVLVVAAVATCVRLGFWQLERLDERRDHNARVSAGLDAPTAALDELLAPGRPADAALEFRHVVAEGRYVPEHAVQVRARALNGRPGQHAVTPLLLSDGRAVLVNRGFVGVVDPAAGLPGPAAPPSGVVRVEGILRRSEERGRFGPQDPDTGRLRHVARVDVARIDRQTPFDLVPMYVQLVASDPEPGELPVALPLPELGEGPHLSYAAQWFLFAAVFTAGYPVLLGRRVGKSSATG